MIDRFWGGDNLVNGKSALNTTISRLRKAIANIGPQADLELLSDRWSVGVRCARPQQIDIFEIQAIYRQLVENAVDHQWAADEILRVYRGPFLPGNHGHWALIERERILSYYVRAMLLIVDRMISQQSYEEAIDYCRKTLFQDPLREAVHLRLILALAMCGDVSRALRHYGKFDTFVRSECDAAPTQRMQEVAVLLSKAPNQRDLEALISSEINLT